MNRTKIEFKLNINRIYQMIYAFFNPFAAATHNTCVPMAMNDRARLTSSLSLLSLTLTLSTASRSFTSHSANTHNVCSVVESLYCCCCCCGCCEDIAIWNLNCTSFCLAVATRQRQQQNNKICVDRDETAR